MRQERLTVIVNGDVAPRDVRIGFGLQALPALCPEPRLRRGHRDDGVQLDHAVLSLDDLDLITRLEPDASTDRGRKREDASRLDCRDLASCFHV